MPNNEAVTRIVLLNSLESRSVSTAPREFKPPLHSALDLLQIIKQRRDHDIAVEYIDAEDDADEDIRKRNGQGKSLIWLKQIIFEQSTTDHYAILLFERLDHLSRKFAVADLATRSGRHLRGGTNDVGAMTSHVCVKMPKQGNRDVGSYRCAIEYVPKIIRRDIQTFLCRQLRRHAAQSDFEYIENVKDKKGRIRARKYKYRPRLELFASLEKGISFSTGADQIVSMVFSRKKEKQNSGKATHVEIDDFVADVEHRVSANDGPSDSEERLGWFKNIRQLYADRGYEAKLYYKNLEGKVAGGKVTNDLSGAADLLMSPKGEIDVSADPDPWRAEIDPDIVAKLRALTDNDDLWARNRRA